MTALLRAGVLAIKPEDIGRRPHENDAIWGVLMELGHPEIVVSLVALIDGSVSIYLSDGDGVIGCGLHPDVRQAALRMLTVAEQLQNECRPVEQFPMPEQKQARFYLLSNRGVLGATAALTALEEGAIELAELFYAGHTVISLVELLGAGVDLIDEIHLAEHARNRRLQLASQLQERAEMDDQQRALKPRGRGCRILPYVGNAARRSQH